MIAAELKIVFTGPMGSGKTTAIAALSDTPPVSTEVANNDQQAFAKPSTTAAMDMGMMSLGDGTVVRLYGTPGQARFSFMWEILARGAMGVIVLIDASSAHALEELQHYTTTFRSISPGQPLVVGVGRLSPSDEYLLPSFTRVLQSAGINAPLFSIDVRRREDAQLLVEAVVSILEARTAEVERGVA